VLVPTRYLPLRTASYGHAASPGRVELPEAAPSPGRVDRPRRDPPWAVRLS